MLHLRLDTTPYALLLMWACLHASLWVVAYMSACVSHMEYFHAVKCDHAVIVTMNNNNELIPGLSPLHIIYSYIIAYTLFCYSIVLICMIL